MAGPLKILIVENHDDIRGYLMMYLEEQGHSVQCAADMQSALEAFQSAPTDVLISDIGLPDGDGWTLLQTLDPKPFAIAISGFGSSIDQKKSELAGYKHHLTKPFLPEELDVLLDEAMRKVKG